MKALAFSFKRFFGIEIMQQLVHISFLLHV